MGLFQLIAQIMGLCGLVAVVALGLLAAPWYILVALLLIVIAVTQVLMPKQEKRISTLSQEVSNSVFARSSHSSSAPLSVNKNETQSSLLMYRGVTYSKKEEPSL